MYKVIISQILLIFEEWENVMDNLKTGSRSSRLLKSSPVAVNQFLILLHCSEFLLQ